MAEVGFHFAAPGWLILLAVPPLVWIWLRLSATISDPDRYRGYADAHLLPLLVGSRQSGGKRGWRRLVAWSLAWALLVLALATPRWGYEERQLFRSGIDLVVLLDLSSSMESKDVAPSRLSRARQEIEDLISQNRGTSDTHARIGLIAFATLPHIVSPLTEDGASLMQQLPALTTDLIQLKGSRLGEALVRAGQMLSGYPKNGSRHILVVSDGDFGDDTGPEVARQLAEQGIHIHALGIGTVEGVPVTTADGRPWKFADGTPVITRLTESDLVALAEKGRGIYRRAAFRNSDTADILAEVSRNARAEAVDGQVVRIWNERFFWPTAAALLLLAPLFRNGRRAGPRGGAGS